jgi:uncharacterized circularly permuted ATP-grasp superfamily protein/uncharacterized alpha-E superfamily protein
MPNKLLADYPYASDHFDEMFDASKQLRPHWQALFNNLASESADIMCQRNESVQRLVQENGVTYNVYADAKGMQRPWDLNVLPLILPQDEWAGIEAAVIQRATLLNQILCDVYGEQKMVAEGLLPSALIHNHDGFLRPCHHIQHSDGIALHFYAVDLARAPNGSWWVLADRTQAPSGAGYALENRSIIARTFPDLIRDLKVQYLGDFFNAMRDSLAYWGRMCATNGGAPLRDSEAPLIVLLTPGPYNETYYEQAYLARYLGLPLVEGNDLTVRNGIVWLKTLSGMRRVHVIMRRVDDDFCDPLELRADSSLGVPGLIEAARSGNVLVANSLGSGLLESGALLGFLPALCERLLGEKLTMPSVATWWCGEPAALEEVIGKLDELVIKPSFPQLRHFPTFGHDLSDQERIAFIAKMRANPTHYVAQEMVQHSQAPVWRYGTQNNLGACSVGLRVYACATPNGYIVMPGGLTRVATGPDARIITMQRGGGSKDTWVQAGDQFQAREPFKRNITRRDLIRDDTHLSSRMAENLFWFGRNAERCDNIARLLRVSLNFLFNFRPESRGQEWAAVQALCTWAHLLEQNELTDTLHLEHAHCMKVPLNDVDIESALLLAVVSPKVPGLARQQQQLFYIASQLRERLSIDNWRALNRMIQRTANLQKNPSQSEIMTILDDATSASMTMVGFTMDGMTRDLGWRFLSMGRRMERLQFQSVALHRALSLDKSGDLDWLLELSDSIITYRARYQARPEWLQVLDLLMLDDSNPRSILFQINGILKALKELSRQYGVLGEDHLTPLKEELLALAPETELYCGNPRLIDILLRIKEVSETLSDQISIQFFSHTGNQRNEVYSS